MAESYLITGVKSLVVPARLTLSPIMYPSVVGIDVRAELGKSGRDGKAMLPYYRSIQTICHPLVDIERDLSIAYLADESKGTNGSIPASFPLTANPIHIARIEHSGLKISKTLLTYDLGTLLVAWYQQPIHRLVLERWAMPEIHNANWHVNEVICM